MKNCPKVRSRRTISLVLCTNRPLFLRGRHRNLKLVLKCDANSNKIDRCENVTVQLTSRLSLTATVSSGLREATVKL
jgi:hypothetical protein